jgi:hypothetical protein
MAMACVDSGNGTDAIPIGVLAGLLWTGGPPSAGNAAARARLETFLGGHTPTDADASAWSEAALSWVERVLGSPDRPEAQRVLARAEQLAREVRAEAFVVRSELLPAALDARLREFAAAVLTALALPRAATLADAEEAFRRAGRHRLAAADPRYLVAEAAVRALRWLSTPDSVPATLAEALARHVGDDGWVDRARLRLWVGVSNPAAAEAYRRLHAATDARRAGTTSGSPGCSPRLPRTPHPAACCGRRTCWPRWSGQSLTPAAASCWSYSMAWVSRPARLWSSRRPRACGGS